MSEEKKEHAKVEELNAANKEAKMAAELAQGNIQRFLSLQAEREGNLIMKAHQQNLTDAAMATQTSSELVALNIRRFLDLQAAREGSLIMRAHQAGETAGRKG